MPLLEGLIAFALTMAALSTAASAVVGFGQRLRRSRARGMRNLVEYLFRHDLLPYLQSQGLFTDAAAAEKAVRQFLVDVALVPTVEPGTTPEGAEDARERWFVGQGLGHEWVALKRITDRIERGDFETRFRRSRAGTALRERLSAEPFEDVVARAADQFESLGSSATERFARSSRPWAVGVSLVVAFGMNVNAFHLLNTYMSDPEVRARVVLDLASASEAAPEAGQEVGDARAELAALSATLPVGWTFYPNCRYAADLRCHGQTGDMWSVARDDTAGFAEWIAGVVLAALMMGLGAPTWVKIADSLTGLRPVFQRDRGAASAEASPAPAPASGAPAAVPSTPRRRLLA